MNIYIVILISLALLFCYLIWREEQRSRAALAEIAQQMQPLTQTSEKAAWELKHICARLGALTYPPAERIKQDLVLVHGAVWGRVVEHIGNFRDSDTAAGDQRQMLKWRIESALRESTSRMLLSTHPYESIIVYVVAETEDLVLIRTVARFDDRTYAEFTKEVEMSCDTSIYSEPIKVRVYQGQNIPGLLEPKHEPPKGAEGNHD